MQATVSQLATIEIFSQLEPEILLQLAANSSLKTYKKKSIVIHEGDFFEAKLHAIFTGNLLVTKNAISGKETTLRQLSAGEMFAAPALFGDRIAPATVIALTDVQIVTIDKEKLMEAIQRSPDIALQILACFNQRLQEMHKTIHGLISEKAVVRLARLIDYNASRYGIELTDQGKSLKVKLPHQQLSRMVGITYEECVRLVRKDLAQIIVYQRGGLITIKDHQALKSLMI